MIIKDQLSSRLIQELTIQGSLMKLVDYLCVEEEIMDNLAIKHMLMSLYHTLLLKYLKRSKM